MKNKYSSFLFSRILKSTICILILYVLDYHSVSRLIKKNKKEVINIEYKLINDKVIKKIFTDYNSGKKYSAKVISEILNLDYEELYNSIESIHPRIGVNKDIVDSEADTVYETDKRIISIEYNLTKGFRTDIKNGAYICELYIKQLPNSNTYDKLKPITQINIDNYDYFEKDKLIYHSMMIEENLHIVDNKYIEIYHVNLPKLRNLSYNEIKKDKLASSLYLFVCDDKKKLDELYKGDKLMEEVRKDADKIIETLDSLLYYNRDEFNRLQREDIIKEGFDEGLNKGIDQRNKEIAKNMLKENIDTKTISNITGLSLEEIDNLK